MLITVLNPLGIRPSPIGAWSISLNPSLDSANSLFGLGPFKIEEPELLQLGGIIAMLCETLWS